MFGLPTEFFHGFVGVGDQSRRISAPPGSILNLDLPSGHLPGDIDYLMYRETKSISQVISLSRPITRQRFECQDVGRDQVGYMDIISNPRSIWSVIVVAKHGDVGADSQSGLQNERNQMTLWMVILPTVTFWIGPGSIKIAQTNEANTMSAGKILQNTLYHTL